MTTIINQLILLEKCIVSSKITKKELNVLKNYIGCNKSISQRLKKDEFFKKICNYYYLTIRKRIITIQRCFRRRLWKIYGPLFHIKDRIHSANNYDLTGEDFWTEVPLPEGDIPNKYEYKNNDGSLVRIPNCDFELKYYFSFFEKSSKENVIYAFDIRSFNECLINGNGINPYTRLPFSIQTINNFKQRCLYSKLTGVNIRHSFELDDIAIQKQNEFDTIDLFNKIETDFGYIVDYTWITEMNFNETQRFIRYIYQLWNLQNPLIKSNIYPVNNNKLFKKTPSQLEQVFTNTAQLHRIAIGYGKRLITTAHNKEHRRYGAWIFLKALSSANLIANQTLSGIV